MKTFLLTLIAFACFSSAQAVMVGKCRCVVTRLSEYRPTPRVFNMVEDFNHRNAQAAWEDCRDRMIEGCPDLCITGLLENGERIQDYRIEGSWSCDDDEHDKYKKKQIQKVREAEGHHCSIPEGAPYEIIPGQGWGKRIRTILELDPNLQSLPLFMDTAPALPLGVVSRQIMRWFAEHPEAMSVAVRVIGSASEASVGLVLFPPRLFQFLERGATNLKVGDVSCRTVQTDSNLFVCSRS